MKRSKAPSASAGGSSTSAADSHSYQGVSRSKDSTNSKRQLQGDSAESASAGISPDGSAKALSIDESAKGKKRVGDSEQPDYGRGADGPEEAARRPSWLARQTNGADEPDDEDGIRKKPEARRNEKKPKARTPIVVGEGNADDVVLGDTPTSPSDMPIDEYNLIQRIHKQVRTLKSDMAAMQARLDGTARTQVDQGKQIKQLQMQKPAASPREGEDMRKRGSFGGKERMELRAPDVDYLGDDYFAADGLSGGRSVYSRPREGQGLYSSYDGPRESRERNEREHEVRRMSSGSAHADSAEDAFQGRGQLSFNETQLRASQPVAKRTIIAAINENPAFRDTLEQHDADMEKRAFNMPLWFPTARTFPGIKSFTEEQRKSIVKVAITAFVNYWYGQKGMEEVTEEDVNPKAIEEVVSTYYFNFRKNAKVIHKHVTNASMATDESH